MQVKYERCCGIDVHKDTVVACVIVSGASGHVPRTIRTFSTMTGDLTALAQWLTATGCRRVPACTGSRCTICWKAHSRFW